MNMEKIINGRRYNTDTAKLVGYWCTDVTDGLDRIEESLYRKKTGEFFLFGVGGPRTKYAGWTDTGNLCSGEKIIPLSEEAAREWAEESLDADEYEAAFDVQEGRVNRSISLTERAAEKAEAQAKENGLSFSAYIEKLIMKG